MPFESQAQRKFMFSQHPGIAKRWAKETPKGEHLPAHKSDPKPDPAEHEARKHNLKLFVHEMKEHEQSGNGHEDLQFDDTPALQDDDRRVEMHKEQDPPAEQQHEQELDQEGEGEMVEAHFDGPGGKPGKDLDLQNVHHAGARQHEGDEAEITASATPVRKEPEVGSKNSGPMHAGHGAKEQAGHEVSPRHETHDKQGHETDDETGDEDLETKHLKFMASLGKRHE